MENSLEDCPAAKRPKLDTNKGSVEVPGNSLQPTPSLSAVSAADGLLRLSSVAGQLLEIEKRSCKELAEVEFGPPITHIYNPLDYASSTHTDYVCRYGNSVKKILFVGMNPGPFGMAQNGVRVHCFACTVPWLVAALWVCV